MRPLIERKLTVKQQNFADLYIELGNATQAAIKAGYSEKYAATNTDKLLKNTNIALYIEERMRQLQSERIASQEEVLERLTAILRGEERGTALVGLGMGEQSVDQVEPTVGEKIRAAELLGKRYKLFTDRVETDNKNRVVIVDDV